jgi:hypothetical protein
VFAPEVALVHERPAPGIPDHVCRDRGGLVIDWFRVPLFLAEVELDHVKEPMGIGEPIVRRTDRHSYKAPDDTAHLVTACYAAHHLGLATSHEGRDYERLWLAAWYPTTWRAFLDRRDRVVAGHTGNG